MPLKKDTLAIGAFAVQGVVWILLIVLEVAFESVAEALTPWAKVSLAIGVLTVLCLIKAVGYFRGICAVALLKLRDHDIVPEGQFVKVMGGLLKHGAAEVTLTFYNIPLSTLDQEKARRLLWEEAIRDNPKVDEFRLLIHPAYLSKLLGYLTSGTTEELQKKKPLASKMHVGVVEFPREEILNFACIIADECEKKLRFASATVMSNPFWNGHTFSHFFLFAGGRKTRDVCNQMKTTLAGIWEQAKSGAGTVNMRFPPNIGAQHPAETRSVQVKQFLTNHDLEDKINEAIKSSQA